LFARNTLLTAILAALLMPTTISAQEPRGGRDAASKANGQSGEKNAPAAVETKAAESLQSKLHASDEEMKVIEAKLRKLIAARQAADTGINNFYFGNNVAMPGGFGGPPNRGRGGPGGPGGWFLMELPRRSTVMTKIRCIVCAVFLICTVALIPQPASAGVVFTTLGPSGQFDSNGGYMVDGSFYNNQVFANMFTLGAGTTVGDAVLALGNFEGADNPVSVYIDSDSSGLPGSKLAAIPFHHRPICTGFHILDKGRLKSSKKIAIMLL